MDPPTLYVCINTALNIRKKLAIFNSPVLFADEIYAWSLSEQNLVSFISKKIRKIPRQSIQSLFLTLTVLLMHILRLRNSLWY